MRALPHGLGNVRLVSLLSRDLNKKTNRFSIEKVGRQLMILIASIPSDENISGSRDHIYTPYHGEIYNSVCHVNEQNRAWLGFGLAIRLLKAVY